MTLFYSQHVVLWSIELGGGGGGGGGGEEGRELQPLV